MSASELVDFHKEIMQEVFRLADADRRFAEDAFFEVYCSHLIEAGELDEADRAHYVSARGIRIDGYGGEPSPVDGTLSLIVADFDQSLELASLTSTEMGAIFKRARTFVVKALDRTFRNQLEETSAGFGLADLIASYWRSISKIRLFLISSRLLSARVDSLPEGEIEGKPINVNVWTSGGSTGTSRPARVERRFLSTWKSTAATFRFFLRT